MIPVDPALQEMQEKIEWIQNHPDLYRAYLRYEKAASDEVTRINGARREGIQEGKLEIARNLKNRGRPIDQIAEDTGLSAEEIEKL